MVGFLLFFKDRFYVFTFYQSSQNIVPEFVPPNCQILLLLTTDWFQTVSRPYIIFFVDSGLCLEKHANWFLGEVTELSLYTIKSPDFLLSIDQCRLLNFFHHNQENQTSKRHATHSTESRLKGNYSNRKTLAFTAFETDHYIRSSPLTFCFR